MTAAVADITDVLFRRFKDILSPDLSGASLSCSDTTVWLDTEWADGETDFVEVTQVFEGIEAIESREKKLAVAKEHISTMDSADFPEPMRCLLSGTGCETVLWRGRLKRSPAPTATMTNEIWKQLESFGLKPELHAGARGTDSVQAKVEIAATPCLIVVAITDEVIIPVVRAFELPVTRAVERRLARINEEFSKRQMGMFVALDRDGIALGMVPIPVRDAHSHEVFGAIDTLMERFEMLVNTLVQQMAH